MQPRISVLFLVCLLVAITSCSSNSKRSASQQSTIEVSPSADQRYNEIKKACEAGKKSFCKVMASLAYHGFSSNGKQTRRVESDVRTALINAGCTPDTKTVAIGGGKVSCDPQYPNRSRLDTYESRIDSLAAQASRLNSGTLPEKLTPLEQAEANCGMGRRRHCDEAERLRRMQRFSEAAKKSQEDAKLCEERDADACLRVADKFVSDYVSRMNPRFPEDNLRTIELAVEGYDKSCQLENAEACARKKQYEARAVELKARVIALLNAKPFVDAIKKDVAENCIKSRVHVEKSRQDLRNPPGQHLVERSGDSCVADGGTVRVSMSVKNVSNIKCGESGKPSDSCNFDLTIDCRVSIFNVATQRWESALSPRLTLANNNICASVDTYREATGLIKIMDNTVVKAKNVVIFEGY